MFILFCFRHTHPTPPSSSPPPLPHQKEKNSWKEKQRGVEECSQYSRSASTSTNTNAHKSFPNMQKRASPSSYPLLDLSTKVPLFTFPSYTHIFFFGWERREHYKFRWGLCLVAKLFFFLALRRLQPPPHTKRTLCPPPTPKKRDEKDERVNIWKSACANIPKSQIIWCTNVVLLLYVCAWQKSPI